MSRNKLRRLIQLKLIRSDEDNDALVDWQPMKIPRKCRMTDFRASNATQYVKNLRVLAGICAVGNRNLQQCLWFLRKILKIS